MHRQAVGRLRAESELHGALERGEFRIHFQPFVSLPDRAVTGVEALLRWQHPERGLVAPGEFVGLAEHNGLIVDIGGWVLDTALQALARCRRELDGGDALTLSVNVSARQLLAGAAGEAWDLPSRVQRALAAADLPPDSLALEITESMVMDAGEDPGSMLRALRRLGVRLMLDDFGTGHSSLSRLSGFPLDVLKIDRSFVTGLGGDGGHDHLVSAIIAMARALGLGVVAEGVETERELEGLVALGCEAAQGYLLGRPVPFEDLAARLAAG
jgi:EAL domain-containing protein (putative c-di-GMP-specific phosphodiesterase class I)